MEKDVVVLIGAGSIGVACARRIATGKHLIIGDINLKAAKKVEEDLYNAGFETSSIQVDLASLRIYFKCGKGSIEIWKY